MMKPWERRQRKKEEKRIAAAGSGRLLVQPKLEYDEEDEEAKKELGRKNEDWPGVEMGNGGGPTKQNQ